VIAILVLLLVLLSPGLAVAQYTGFTIPNQPQAAFAAQGQVLSQDFQAITEALRGNGVLSSGCQVTAKSPTTMQVHVSACSIQWQTVTVAVTAVDLTVATADSLNPRLDLVSITGSGTVVLTSGSPSQAPLPPVIPQSGGFNNIPVAFVYVPARTLVVMQNQLTDKRAFVGTGGGGASLNAPFLLTSAFAGLTSARVFIAGSGLSGADSGPGGSLTLTNTGVTALAAGTGISVSGATGAVTVGNTGVTAFNTLVGAVTLAAGTNITLTPVGNTVTVSATGGASVASSLAGVVTISGTATTAAVVFGVPQADTNYIVTGWTRPSAGTPPSVTSDYLTKLTTGFTARISAAPGAGNSVEVNWELSRPGTTGSLFGGGTAPKIAVWSGPTTLTDYAGSACGASNFVASISAAGVVTCAVPAGTAAAVLRVCTIVIGADNGAVLVDGDLGPQRKQCMAPVAGTVVAVTVASDAGTPDVIVGRRHCTTASCTTGANETVSNLVSSALAAGPGTACSKVGATAGYDTFTTCSATLQNTALAAGDFVELVSGTAGGVAKRVSVVVTWSEP